MTPAGFTRPVGRSKTLKIWVVTFLDIQNEPQVRRTAGAFPNRNEAERVVRALEKVRGSVDHVIEPAEVFRTFEDWEMLDPELESADGGVPGLHQAKSILPEFTGHRCIGVNRITRQLADEAPTTEAIELLWATGATVVLGVERESTMLVSNRAWVSPTEGQDPAQSTDGDDQVAVWRSRPTDAPDPLARLVGEKVRTFSVAENGDGFVMSMQIGFQTLVLSVAVVGKEFRFTVAEK
jgi:hypothetical protein